MKKIIKMLPVIAIVLFLSCSNNKTGNETTVSPSPEPATAGQSGVTDEESMKDVVKVAVASSDHTTLVAAIKQADLVDALSSAGPFTVFAPTNSAFDKLPAGTVDGLMKPEKKADLQNILQYHVTTSSLKADFFKDGMTISMANGGTITVSVKDGKVILNNSATIIGSVQASNGMVHVIDAVLLPK